MTTVYVDKSLSTPRMRRRIVPKLLKTMRRKRMERYGCFGMNAMSPSAFHDSQSARGL